MYIDERFHPIALDNTAGKILDARDEFLASLTEHPEEAPSHQRGSLFWRFDVWLTVKSAELDTSIFIDDREAVWARFLEIVPAIYLAAVEQWAQSPELRQQFWTILPSPPQPDGGMATDRDRVAFLLQGADLSWPIPEFSLMKDRRTTLL
ncbi:hypothetical protein [Rhodococcus ruber]|uniref:hypothetical protein n=1 Tax=Rhodococcus ruber TaxID=1830 RepID=UPI001F4770F9|nr:hypothetical protein [Rhodococcus ruber]MCF8785255.1 hypothetical protein [Rhodococcus ruber]